MQKVLHIYSSDKNMISLRLVNPALDDNGIRQALMSKLANSSVKPKAIIEELRVHNGNAIADVVAVYKEAHCYEIKGESDSVNRIIKQGAFYDLVFSKVTLVTTSNHLSLARTLAPSHWGIVQVTLKGDRFKFIHHRAAKPNRLYNKKLALLTLWRCELTEVANEICNENLGKLNRDGLTNLISERIGRTRLMNVISEKLIERSTRLRSL